MKWLLILIVIFHGLIHLMGGVNELGLAEVKGLTGKTLFSLPNSLQPLFGVLWFITVILFLIAAVGLMTNNSWWKSLAFVAVGLSQLLIVIWWPDAKWGTLANILILSGTFLYKQ